MKKYRKKPIVIEAVQFLQETLNPELVNFLGEEKNYPECKIGGINPSTGKFMIKTLEGHMIVNIGDFIVKGINGEFYPVKKEIFLKTYEEI